MTNSFLLDKDIDVNNYFDIKRFVDKLTLEDAEYFIDNSPFSLKLKCCMLSEMRSYFGNKNKSEEVLNVKSVILNFLKNVLSNDEDVILLSDQRKDEIDSFLNIMTLKDWKYFINYFQFSKEIVEIMEWQLDLYFSSNLN